MNRQARRVRRHGSLAIALAVSVAAAGCSTTRWVDGAGTQSASAATRTARGSAGGGADDGFGAVTTDTTVVGQTVSSGSPTRRTTASGSAPRAGSGAAGAKIPAGKGAHGVTDSTIEVGVLTADSAAVNSVGAAASGNPDSSFSNMDFDRANAAIADAVNASGGIAGRKVVLVAHKANVQNATTQSGLQQEAAAACATWTQDHHVFAMMGLGGSSIFDCAKQTRTPVVTQFIDAHISESHYRTMSDYFYAPSRFIADDEERVKARFLLKHDFFGKGAKVGLMIQDDPDVIAGVEKGMKPLLAAAGIPMTEIRYHEPISSPWPNYVLQMQSAGVTHIVFSAANATFFPPLFMMRAAQNQRYYPKWALGSDLSPSGLGPGFGNAPPEQLRNLLGVGWSPLVDVGDSNPQGAIAKKCNEALERAGQPVGATTTCEFLFFLQSALRSAKEVSPAAMAAAVDALGDAYPSIWTIGGATRFTKGRHTGAAVLRAVTYDANSPSGLVYSSPPEQVAY